MYGQNVPNPQIKNNLVDILIKVCDSRCMETNNTKKFEGYCNESSLPIKQGMTVTIKKGVMVKTVYKEAKPAGKTYKIKVHHILPGHTKVYHRQENVAPYNFIEVRENLENPKLVWAGPGGYWSEVDINDVPEAFFDVVGELK